MEWHWRERILALAAARTACFAAADARREPGGVERRAEAARALHQALADVWPPHFFEGLARLAAARSEPEDVERVLDFLEVNPMFFRSGYIAGKALRFLPRGPLSKKQRARANALCLAAIDAPRRPGFRLFCKFARQLGGRELMQAVEARAEGGAGLVRTRANEMREAMNARVSRKRRP